MLNAIPSSTTRAAISSRSSGCWESSCWPSPRSSRRYRSFYLIISSFELYLYHQLAYDGIFKQILDSLNSVNAVLEELFLTNFFKELLQKNTELTDFNFFSNWKYIEVEGINSLFASNLMVMYSMKFLLRVVNFLFLNWLFNRLFQKRVSKILRVYSFKVYLIEILLLGEAPGLAFLFINHVQMLFFSGKASPEDFVVHTISVSLYWILFLLILSLFFLYKKMYPSLVKYFYNNLRPVRGSLQYCWIRYALKPTIVGCLHALFFGSPPSQLLSLSLV